MKQEDLISIIVPIYNVEKYLNACIDSIINQTYKKIEIILVNDGSTDNSNKICLEYCKKDNRVKLINKKNGGLSSARNTGIDNATGQYICFVDSDDVIDINYINYLYNGIFSTKSDISCCKYKRFVDGTEIELNGSNQISNLNVIKNRDYIINTFYQINQELYSVSACNKLYNINIFEKIKFPEGKLFEDLAIVDDLISKVNKIAVIDNELYYYRITKNSITTSNFNSKKFVVLEHCKRYLEKYKDDKEMYNATLNLLFSREYEILANMKIAKYIDKNNEKKIWNDIKKNRISILKNKKTRKIAKISVILSYFGKNTSVKMLQIFKKYKAKRGIM